MKIIAKPDADAGLSNRIKCLVSAMHLAKQNKAGLVVSWQPSFSCGCELHHLFDNPFMEVPKNWEYKQPEDIVVNTWKFPDIPKEKILKYLNKLKIKENITKEASNFFKGKFFYASIIGVHVRRNEFLLNSEKKKSTDELFFKRMDEMIEHNPEVYFFLATDSLKTEDEFYARYGAGRIITYPKKYFNRSRPETIKEALIELLILAQCRKILGSSLSTYSEMAYWFSNCKADIEYIGKPDNPIKIESQKTSMASSINQSLRRNSGIYRWIMRQFGWWA